MAVESLGQSTWPHREKLELIDKASSESLNHLFDYTCGAYGSMPLPRPALHKQVCDEMFWQRSQALSRVSVERFDKLLKQDYTFDWVPQGAFRSSTDQHGDIVLVHCDGKLSVFPLGFL